MVTDRELLRRLTLTRDLPTLPQVVSYTLSVLQTEKSSAEDVAEILAEDPAMTASVLRIANSVFFNPTTNKIGSVPVALARIGFEEVYQLVIAIGVVDLFRKSRAPFNYRKYWRHCIASALLSELIADRACSSPTANPGERKPYFVSGLLHDIGMLPMAERLSDRYGRLIQAFERQEESFDVLEAQRLGVTHSEVGAALIRHWNIPGVVSAAAEAHHDPERAPAQHRLFVRVIHAADWIASSFGYGIARQKNPPPLGEETWCKLGLSSDDLPDLRREFEKSADDSKLFLVIEKS